MTTYLIRRLLLIIPTLWVVTIIVFLSVRLIPGDVLTLMAGEIASVGFGQEMSVEEVLEDLRHSLGFDRPVHIQYLQWLKNVFRGNLGESLWNREPIARELLKRIPVSLELGIIGLLTALALAIPIGIYSGVRHETLGDHFGRSVAILAISVPNF